MRLWRLENFYLKSNLRPAYIIIVLVCPIQQYEVLSCSYVVHERLNSKLDVEYPRHIFRSSLELMKPKKILNMGSVPSFQCSTTHFPVPRGKIFIGPFKIVSLFCVFARVQISSFSWEKHTHLCMFLCLACVFLLEKSWLKTHYVFWMA